MNSPVRFSSLAIATVFSCCMLLLSHPVVRAEVTADTVTFSLPDMWAMPGDTVTVPLSVSMVSTADGIWSLQGSIKFDRNIVSVIDVTKEGTLTDSWDMDPNYNDKGDSVTVAFPSTEPLRGSGAMLIITLRVLETAATGEISPIQICPDFIVNEGTPRVSRRNAQLTVGEPPRIDVSHILHDFGTVDMDESAQVQITVSNQGMSDLILMDLYVDSDQVDLGSTEVPLTIEAGGSQILKLTYQPTTEGDLFSSLRITSNDPTNPIAVVELSGVGINTTGVEDDLRMNQLPEQYRLYQNYPNPFNPETTIAYQIPALDTQPSSFVSLKVYNMLGQEVRTLVNAPQEPGNYRITWTAADEAGNPLPSGIYAYRLLAGEFTQSKRMVYVR